MNIAFIEVWAVVVYTVMLPAVLLRCARYVVPMLVALWSTPVA
jgi:hypothetical protein